jgi:hypothetical protein
MPKQIILSEYPSTGIKIRWTPTSSRIDVNGWFDSLFCISGGSLTLREFFDRLGITEKDCAKAFKEQPKM